MLELHASVAGSSVAVSRAVSILRPPWLDQDFLSHFRASLGVWEMRKHRRV